MKSKSKISMQMKRKRNPELVEIITKLKKTNPAVAGLLSTTSKNQIEVNVEKIEKEASAEGGILIPGKVLGDGRLSKKTRVVALSATKNAIEKIKAAKGEFVSLKKEIEKNPELKDLILIK